jgi:broad specificity phosphatase PhoE
MTPKGGEGLEEFNKRVSSIIEKLVEENRGNRIIVVTTPDVVQAAIALTLNLTPENQFKNLIKTGSLTQISYFVNDWSSVIYSDYMPL